MTRQSEHSPLNEPVAVVAEPLQVRPEDIPLPPKEMWGELDNFQAEERPGAVSTASIPAAPTTSMAIAKLAFIGGKAWSQSIPLDFPFEWDGREISTITVRRLTTAEMGEVVGRVGSGFDQWDIFAAMAGLPADVLRGLEAGDGDAVTGVAWDFLPRSLRKSD